LRRVAVEVSLDRAEDARAAMLELFPAGFEEVERDGGVELAAYTDAQGEERLWHVFGGAQSTVVPDGWEDRWRTFHKPVQVGRLWVGPPWEEPAPGLLAVVVDPGRAFGTGAHPTTRLCLELLQHLEPQPLLDVGCGSGVLAIAAALLGYRPATGVDTEEAAVEATRANAHANGVEVEARVVAAAARLPAVPVAVANISLEAVRTLPARLDARELVTSGYLADTTLELDGYVHAERLVLDGWAADVHRRA
jgi:ribosomal protein L11 methyltransferase